MNFSAWFIRNPHSFSTAICCTYFYRAGQTWQARDRAFP